MDIFNKKKGRQVKRLTYEKIYEDVKSKLSGNKDFEADSNLIQLGLNSIQIMRLINSWRKIGIKASFADLISNPTLKEWYHILGGDGSELIEINEYNGELEKVNMYEAFDLTDIQYAYWIGRRDGQILGGVGCHAYLEIDGENVDPDRLQKAWIKLLNHHPMLRAKFLKEGKQQILKQPSNTLMEIHDLRRKEKFEEENELESIRNRLSHRRFNIENGEVAGLEISLLKENKTRIHFDIDLLISDVQSMQIILRDLVEAYIDENDLVSPADWNFADYLKRDKYRNREEVEKSKLYWKKRISSLPGAPKLPLRKKPKDVTKTVFNGRKYFVSRENWNRLKSKAALNKVTPAMVLLTAYAEVIDRWSSESEFLINIPLFNRRTDEEGIEEVVADFTNLLLLSVDCSEIESFLERVKKIQRQFYKDVAYSAYSGVHVQRDLARVRKGESNFAPIVFACNIGTPFLNDDFCRTLGTLNYIISQTPQVYLDFQIYEIDGGLLLKWDSVDELFPEGLIDSMFKSYINLINKLCEEKNYWETVIDTNPELEEKNKLIIDTSIKSKSLISDFYKNVDLNPESTAVIEANSGKHYSYGEIAEYALKTASLLSNEGIKNGDLVEVCISRSAKQIAAIIGILSVGAAYVPISTTQPFERRKIIQDKASIRHVITTRELANELEWPENTVVLNMEDALQEKPLKNPLEVSADSLAYIIFTSGSTGQPKGVKITHGGAYNTICDINRKYNVCCEDNILAVSSYDFDLSVYDIFGMLNAGGTIVLISEDTRRDSVKWCEFINKYSITIWNSVPILLDMLLITAESLEKKLSSIRLCLLSGDWINMNLPKRLKSISENSRMIALGGATEASIWSNYFEVSLPIPDKWKSIPYGHALSNQIYRVADGKNRDCPDWVQGELWIGGRGISTGYVADDENNKSHFTDYNNARWYRTGDYGRFWPDGNIEFLGRKDFQVKIRGHRIELGEIECALKKYAGIKNAAVNPIGDPHGNKYLAAYIIKEKNIQVDEKDLRNFLTQMLPQYMVPSAFVYLEEMPLTYNGKIDRKGLPKIDFENKVSEIEPKTEIEKELAAIWKELLKVSKISLNDNYFELGGDSLLATKLVAMVRNKLNVELALEDIFKNNILGDQAKCIKGLIKNKSDQNSKMDLPEIISDKDNLNEPFPLTDIQQAYWIGRRGVYDLGNVATHYYFEIEGKNLNVDKINEAWQMLIKRHEMMRAVILNDGENQVIYKEVPEYRIKVLDLNNTKELDYEKQLLKIRDEMSYETFDTEKWPLFDVRATCYDENVRIHISFDNIIFDGGSIINLLNEWNELYKHPDKLEKPFEISFRDYVLAMSEVKKTRKYEEDKKYWYDRLDDLAEAPQLPLINNSDTIKEQKFSHVEKRLNKEQYTKLKNIARKFSITVSGILLSAYSEILGAWSTTQKFTINLTRFNRLPMNKEINKIIGDFTTLTLLEVDNSKGNMFLERCKNVQEQLWRDLDHSYVCGVDVQRELSKRRGNYKGAVMPIVFTSSLGLNNVNSDDEKGWFGKRIYNISQTPQVWLDHQVMEEDEELILSWDYVKDLFPNGLVDDMFESYTELVGDLLENEDRWTEKCKSNILIPRKEERIIANNTNELVSKENIVTLFKKSVSSYGNKLAVVSKTGNRTYKELDKISDNIAEYLIKENVKPNTLIAIIMEKGFEQVVGALGILKSGAAYLPIDPTNPEDRINLILKEGNVDIVLTQSWITEKIKIEDKFKTINVDKIKFKELRDEDKGLKINNEDLAYVIYTSGSTGKPKGVMISHKGAVNTILDVNKKFNVNSDDSVLALSNLNFDLSVYDIFGMLSVGGTIVIPASDFVREPSYYVDIMKKEKITVWNTVPAFMQMLIEYVENIEEELPQSLRVVLLSGDKIPVNLPDRIKGKFNNAEVVALGGATEASIWSNYYKVDSESSSLNSIPYGRPLANQQFYVFNDLMEDCPVWVTGKMYIGGAGVAKGYWNNEEKTAERFIKHPKTGETIYYTGDLGRYLPGGILEYMGREDFQVKINGFRIELGEIESCIKMLDGVKDVVVNASETGKDRILTAYVVPKDDVGSDIFNEKSSSLLENNVRWDKVIGSMSEYYSILSDIVNEQEVTSFMEQMDNLSVRAICSTLYKIGIFTNGGEAYSVSELMKKFNLKHRFKVLINHWMQILCNNGILLNKEETYCNNCSLKDYMLEGYKESKNNISKLLNSKLNEMKQAFENDIDTHIKLLRGETDPLELFLTNKSTSSADSLSKFNIAEEYYKDIIKKIFNEIIKCSDENKLVKVMEVGTRMGNLTKDLINSVHNKKIEYVYTDESTFFLERKQTLMNEDDLISYKVFNMNKDLIEQNIKRNSFDLIIADNTLHRSKDIDSTLKKLKDMLLPGGIILFIESTSNSTMMMNTVAFFEDGFSHFEDERSKTNLPLLGKDEWIKKLEDAGYYKTASFPGKEKVLDSLKAQVFVGQAPEIVRIFNSEKISNFISKKLPEYMVPSNYILLEKIPITPNGKIDRKQLNKLADISTTLDSRERIVPYTETQKKIESVWREILNNDQISVDDDFFRLGGDSLRAIQCINILKKRYDINVSLKDIFGLQNIISLAQFIDENNELTDEELDEGEI